MHRPGHEIGAEQDVLRAVERIEAAADPIDIIIDVARGMSRQRDDRADRRKQVSHPVVQLAHQQIGIFLPAFLLGDVDADAGQHRIVGMHDPIAAHRIPANAPFRIQHAIFGRIGRTIGDRFFQQSPKRRAVVGMNKIEKTVPRGQYRLETRTPEFGTGTLRAQPVGSRVILPGCYP